MFLGRVIGQIFATIQHPFYKGKKMLAVERTNEKGEASGGYVIAVDAVDAGVGQVVLINDEGNGARQVFSDSNAPVRSVIVGIVDQIDLE